MSKMKEAMADIEASSRKIDDILGVIESVVQQNGQLLLKPEDLGPLSEALAAAGLEREPGGAEAAAGEGRGGTTLEEITSTLQAIVDDVAKVSDHVEAVARSHRLTAPTVH